MKGKTAQKPFSRQASLFKLLSHPGRLAILEILRHGQECVCHMEAALGYRQAYISQQLAVLRQAGLVTDTRDGWNVYYRVANKEIFKILDAVNQVVGFCHETDEHVLSCACPKCVERARKQNFFGK